MVSKVKDWMDQRARLLCLFMLPESVNVRDYQLAHAEAVKALTAAYELAQAKEGRDE